MGVSLIELLVGLVIGLLVVLAALGSLAYTRTAAKLVGDSTRLQQDAATAFRIIGNAARQAGARRLVDSANKGSQVMFNPQYAGFGIKSDTGHPMTLRGSDGASNAPDTLELHRDSDSSKADSADCLGEPTTEDHAVTSLFRVESGTLACDGSGSSRGAYRFVSGVEDFQVWYGMREGNGLRYITASALTTVTPAPWDRVEALRVCLRLAGELTNNPVATGNGCNGEAIQNDGRLRRVFFRVIKLRNAGL